MKAVDYDRDRRFQSAQEMKQALLGAASGLPATVHVPQGAAPPPPPTSRAPLFAIGGVLAVLVGVVLTILIRQIASAPTSPAPIAVAAIATSAAPAAPAPTPTTGDAARPAGDPPSTSTALPPVAPTTTPAPTEVPSSTPIPEPTATPPCALGADTRLTSAWIRNEMGCPQGAGAIVWVAGQTFERGTMLWRSDTDRVTALFGNGAWTEFLDRWAEGSPIPSRGTPPAGRLVPQRGFGYIWGIHDQVAQGLGWALEDERGYCARVQSFERGFLLRSERVQSCMNGLYNWANDPSFTPVFLAVYGNGVWRD